MAKIKAHYRLIVNNFLRFGQWDHYPTDAEIAEAIQKRLNNKYFINNERVTFQVEKIQFFDPHDLQVGDHVEVIEYFYFYDESYDVGKRFHIGEEHVKHGLEKFVKKVTE